MAACLQITARSVEKTFGASERLHIPREPQLLITPILSAHTGPSRIDSRLAQNSTVAPLAQDRHREAHLFVWNIGSQVPHRETRANRMTIPAGGDKADHLQP